MKKSPEVITGTMAVAASKQGDSEAQYNLWLTYDFGEGVEEDNVKAAKRYRLAAEQGNAKAQCGLGVAYSRGDGVEEDKVEAAKWFRLAAEQGNADAQCNLVSRAVNQGTMAYGSILIMPLIFLGPAMHVT